MNKAPKNIWVNYDEQTMKMEFPELYTFAYDPAVEYIRKDVYDARIKQLEEVLRNSLRCGWHSMEGSLDGTFDDLTEQEIRQFREDAKNALEKESE